MKIVSETRSYDAWPHFMLILQEFDREAHVSHSLICAKSRHSTAQWLRKKEYIIVSSSSSEMSL